MRFVIAWQPFPERCPRHRRRARVRRPTRLHQETANHAVSRHRCGRGRRRCVGAFTSTVPRLRRRPLSWRDVTGFSTC